MKISNFARSLFANSSGVSMVEFAMIMPIVTVAGMYGVEIAYMTSAQMAMSQLALSLADNASRMEQTTNTTVAPTVTEADVSSIMKGSVFQGLSFGFATNGRAILSSLEKDPTTGKQFIHWQRCTGNLAVQSAYGNDSNLNGLNGPAITSLGQGATKISANTGIAVMFVEVYYDYNGLFGTMFVKKTRFKQEAAFIVRDSRDLRASNVSGITGTGNTTACT